MTAPHHPQGSAPEGHTPGPVWAALSTVYVCWGSGVPRDGHHVAALPR
jgi:hypothetical protein